MLTETANVPGGQGLGYPPLLEKESGNKIEKTQLQLSLIAGKNNLLQAEREYHPF